MTKFAIKWAARRRVLARLCARASVINWIMVPYSMLGAMVCFAMRIAKYRFHIPSASNTYTYTLAGNGLIKIPIGLGESLPVPLPAQRAFGAWR